VPGARAVARAFRRRVRGGRVGRGATRRVPSCADDVRGILEQAGRACASSMCGCSCRVGRAAGKRCTKNSPALRHLDPRALRFDRIRFCAEQPLRARGTPGPSASRCRRSRSACRPRRQRRRSGEAGEILVHGPNVSRGYCGTTTPAGRVRERRARPALVSQRGSRDVRPERGYIINGGSKNS